MIAIDLQEVARFVVARNAERLAALPRQIAALPDGVELTPAFERVVCGTMAYHSEALGIAVQNLAVAVALAYPVFNGAWLRRMAAGHAAHPDYRPEWRL
jgi:hypothetical protein